MTALVARFQRSRWSAVRQRIDYLKPGQSSAFPREQRDAIMTAIRRTESAYGDRKYTTRGGDQYATGPITVTRAE